MIFFRLVEEAYKAAKEQQRKKLLAKKNKKKPTGIEKEINKIIKGHQSIEDWDESEYVDLSHWEEDEESLKSELDIISDSGESLIGLDELSNKEEELLRSELDKNKEHVEEVVLKDKKVHFSETAPLVRRVQSAKNPITMNSERKHLLKVKRPKSASNKLSTVRVAYADSKVDDQGSSVVFKSKKASKTKNDTNDIETMISRLNVNENTTKVIKTIEFDKDGSVIENIQKVEFSKPVQSDKIKEKTIKKKPEKVQANKEEKEMNNAKNIDENLNEKNIKPKMKQFVRRSLSADRIKSPAATSVGLLIIFSYVLYL